MQVEAKRATRSRLAAELKKLETQEANLLDVAADGELTTTVVKDSLRDLAVRRRVLVDKLSLSDQQAQRQAKLVVAYLDLFSRPYAFYVTASDPTKRKILEAFFTRILIEDDKQQIVARVEVQEPIALLRAAANEWKASTSMGASGIADALDDGKQPLSHGCLFEYV